MKPSLRSDDTGPMPIPLDPALDRDAGARARQNADDAVARPGLGHTASASYADLLQAMTTFDPPVAAMAAQRGDAQTLARLEENVRATPARFDEQSFVPQVMAFSRLLAQMSGNRALLLGRAQIAPLIAPFLRVVLSRVPGAGLRWFEAHQAILACVQQRDAHGAREAMRAHLRSLRSDAQAAELDLRALVSLTETSPAEPMSQAATRLRILLLCHARTPTGGRGG